MRRKLGRDSQSDTMWGYYYDLLKLARDNGLLISALGPDLSQTNIGITEIAQNPSSLEDSLHPLDVQGYEPVPSSGWHWFTQRVSYGDPCEEFKKSFPKMKKK